jgi:phosphatidylglycerol:prolipoprotein diacylglycerol transferase
MPLIDLVLPFPDIDPFAVQIGPIGIRWYALAYIVGLLLGWRYVMMLTARPRLWPNETAPFAPDRAETLLFFCTFGVILGGRLGYVLFYNFGYYLDNPMDILKTWHGGMSFHGGFLGVVIGALMFCRLNPAPMLSTADALACATPFGLLFGRIANFINGELWGKPWDGGWAFVFPADPAQVPRHPSQLYEAGLEGLLLMIVLAVVAWNGGLKRPGLVAGLFIAGYGASRAFVELFREPNPGLDCVIAPLGQCLQMGQLLSLPMVAVGLGLAMIALSRRAA